MSSKRINLGIIGTGEFAKEYYFPKCESHPNIDIHSIANRSEAKSLEIADKYRVGIDYVFTGEEGWKKLINDEKVDAIVIATPNFLHAPIAIEAARKGIHVLVEKPMAIAEEEAYKMIESSKKNSTILMVSFPQRFIPAFEKAKEVIDEGIIGDIQTIQSTYGHSGPEFWSASGKWYFETSKSHGGVLLDLGSHQVDTISWLVGDEISEVSAMTSTLDKEITVEDNSFLSLKFSRGCMGFVASSWTTKPDMINNLSVHGSKGALYLEHNRLKVRSLSEERTYLDLPSRGHDAKVIAVGKLIDHFVQCVLEQDVPLTSGKDGLMSLQTILAGYQSSSSHSLVKL